jgi:hypothetical protein
MHALKAEIDDTPRRIQGGILSGRSDISQGGGIDVTIDRLSD